MLSKELLKEYVQAFLGYEDEARQLKDARKDFRGIFMERNALTKSDLKLLENAIKINMKMDTEFEINMFVDSVQQVSEYFNKTAPGNEKAYDGNNPLLDEKPKTTERPEWNPPPAPIIPKKQG